MDAAEFQCSDPFRRMVVTWDGRHTMPCCQGFTLEIDGGAVMGVPGAPADEPARGLGEPRTSTGSATRTGSAPGTGPGLRESRSAGPVR